MKTHSVNGVPIDKLIRNILLTKKQPIALGSGDHSLIVEGFARREGQTVLKILNSWGERHSGWFKADPILSRTKIIAFIDDIDATEKAKPYVMGDDGIAGTIFSGDIALVKKYLEENHKILLKKSPLALGAAITLETTDILKLLLDEGALVNASNADGTTAFWHACQKKNVPAAQMLVNYGADFTVTDDLGVSPLIIAADKGSLETVNFLLNLGVKVDLPDHRGQTALYAACQHGHSHIISRLLEEGANPNDALTEETGTSPLMIAAFAGHSSAVVTLLASPHIEIDKTQKDGKTAIMVAVLSNDENIFDLIFRHSPDVGSIRNFV